MLMLLIVFYGLIELLFAVLADLVTLVGPDLGLFPAWSADFTSIYHAGTRQLITHFPANCAGMFMFDLVQPFFEAHRSPFDEMVYSPELPLFYQHAQSVCRYAIGNGHIEEVSPEIDGLSSPMGPSSVAMALGLQSEFRTADRSPYYWLSVRAPRICCTAFYHHHQPIFLLRGR
jgi:hypothetical protein